MPGLIPPLLLLLFGAWCGTFAGSAGFAGSTVGIAALLATLASLGTPWPDPLGLGRLGRLLPPAVWIAAAVSAWRSPVPRAAWMAVLLLPAFLMLPGTVARCWTREADRRLGARAVAVLTSAVSLWALIDWRVRDLPRVAMPLGHHNLLATWLVILLPLALIAAREPGPWRWVGLAGGFLPAATILATQSLAGNLALAAEALVVLIVLARARRSWAWAVGFLMLVAALGLFAQRARILSIVAGTDLSVQGRLVYYEGAWEGFLARPGLGWGPGSAAWTAAAFFDPVPGVSPFGESVGELHSLPLHLAYELGATGLVLSLALVAAFFVRRLAGRRRAEDSVFLLAGLTGLLGAAVASLGSAALAVPALPLAAAVAAGTALAGDRAPAPSRRPILLYGVLAVLALAPLQAARWFYDRAVAAAVANRNDDAREALGRAVGLDPRFPLYRMRLALLQEPPIAAETALQAARDGLAVPTLWTVAGLLGSSAQRPWAAEALERACALDPLNPFPPFYRMALEPAAAEAPRRGAHALMAEPRLGAATLWETRPDLLARAAEEVRRWPGVDMGWKEALIASLPTPMERHGDTARLQLEIDTTPDLALSLHTFRRRPFPAQWPLVQLRMAPLEKLRLPPATTLRGTPARTFSLGCHHRERSADEQTLLIR